MSKEQLMQEYNDWSRHVAMQDIGFRADMLDENGWFCPRPNTKIRPAHIVSIVDDAKDNAVTVTLTTHIKRVRRDTEEGIEWLTFGGWLTDAEAVTLRKAAQNLDYLNRLKRYRADRLAWGEQVAHIPEPEAPSYCDEHGYAVCTKCQYPF